MEYTKLRADNYQIICLRAGVEIRFASCSLMPLRQKERKSFTMSEIKKREAEVNANAQRLVKCWNEYDSLKAKADVCDELVEALKKYAGHLPACECMWKTLQSRKCTCGFEQTLAKAKRIE